MEGRTQRWVLVLNCGSSSVKFAVVDPASGARALSGLAERLGGPDAVVRLTTDAGTATRTPEGSSHREVVDLVLAALAELPDVAPAGVGHRVVHGGERFSTSVAIDEDVLAAIRDCSRLAPLHNPANLDGIEAARAALPAVPHVAVFDTAFHARMPAHAYRYAVPTSWYADHGVRRYGFHGTSHRFVSEGAAAALGRPLEEVRLVTAHLGNGCSAAAVLHGVSVDTTMGLTPLEGLVMGTRSGDVDPGLFAYLADRCGLDAATVTDALNRESGLRGLSGVGNDLRAVSEAAAAGNPDAELALEVFCHRLAKHVAALVVPLGGLDALVFTGGIGEHSVLVRRRVLARLAWLGLLEDEAANEADGRGHGGRITRPGPVQALVVPTDEELLIARDTAEVLEDRGGS